MSCPSELELARSLTNGGDAELAAHLATCASCRAAWDGARAAIEVARELPVAQPSPGRREEVRTAILAAAAGPAQPPRRRIWYAPAIVLAGAAGVVGYLATRASAPSAPHAHGTVRPHAGARYVISSVEPDEVIRLSDGALDVEVEPLHPGERFRVVVGTAELEVRGTAFQVTASAERLVEVTVAHGRVDLTPDRGAPSTLAAGQAWHAVVAERALSLPSPPPASAAIERRAPELSAEHREAQAERREPSTERREPQAERRDRQPQAVAERREPQAVSREPQAERREPSAERRGPSADRREPQAVRREAQAVSREPSTERREPQAVRREAQAVSREPSTERREPSAERRNREPSAVAERRDREPLPPPPAVAERRGREPLPQPSPPPASRAAEEIAYDDAWTALRSGDFTRAASGFARVVLLAPDSPLSEDASFWRAVALARGKRSAEAVSAFHDFLDGFARSPRIGEASAMLGWLLIDARAFDEAARRFTAASADPDPRVRDSARAGLAALATRPR